MDSENPGSNLGSILHAVYFMLMCFGYEGYPLPLLPPTFLIEITIENH